MGLEPDFGRLARLLFAAGGDIRLVNLSIPLAAIRLKRPPAEAEIIDEIKRRLHKDTTNDRT